MNIVAAGPLAADVFAALHAKSFDPPWSASAFHGMLLGMGAFGLIAMDGDQPCGMLVSSAIGDSAEILTIAVSDIARRRGVARALMLAAQSEALARGATFVVLDVAADNEAARALYEALGYAQIGMRKGYYQSGPPPARDALVLRKSIVP